LDDWEENEPGRIELPDGLNFQVQKVGHVRHPTGNRTFIGKIQSDGRTYTSVFTYGDAGIVGEIRKSDGIYVLGTIDDEPQLIDVQAVGWRVAPYHDDARPPRSTIGTTEPQDVSSEPGTSERSNLKLAEAAPTPQTTVDVLVAYTHAMVTRAGSVAGAQLRVDQLIAIT